MRILTWAVAMILVVLVAFLGGYWVWGRDLPDVSDLDVLEYSGQTRVYDRNGALVGALSPSLASGSRVNRTLLKLNQVSPYLQKAVVTSEDRRFHQHHGIDFLGIARGLLHSLRGDLEGGSTLTQQLVKNTLLMELQGARTAERKFKEAILAVQVDRRFSKDEILGAYLNVIYWGSGGKSDIIGAGTAARSYFQKDASQLNLAESVYLATLIPTPRRYFNYEAYRPLMRSLLDRMVEDGQITPAEADSAWRYPLQPAGWRVRYDAQGNVTSAALVDETAKNRNTPALSEPAHLHFLQTVERELIQRYGRKALYSGAGLKAYTTMDLTAQRAAEQASRNANVPGGASLGIALVAPDSGEVLALVGQKLAGGRTSEWNNATMARRQVGSSIKPLLYALALQEGYSQADTILDAPIEGDYQPKNYDGRYLGEPVTLRYALNHSLNLPTVRLAQQVGLRDFERKLRELGLEPPADAGLSLAIGTLEASPLQMASAYATFANGGMYHEPSFLKRVENGEGEQLPLPKPASRRVWDAETAYLGLDLLRGVVNDLNGAQGGLGWRARIPGWEVGGKTGTTNDVKDLWFAGVTPTVAGAVWVGKQEGGAMPQNAYSGVIAAPIWQQAVAGALQGQARVAFKPPEGIEYRWVRGVNMAFKTQGQDLTSGLKRFFNRTREVPAQEAVPPVEEPAEDVVEEVLPPLEEVPVEEPVIEEPIVEEPLVEEPAPVPPDAAQPDTLQPAPAPEGNVVPVPPDLQPLPGEPVTPDPAIPAPQPGSEPWNAPLEPEYPLGDADDSWNELPEPTLP